MDVVSRVKSLGGAARTKQLAAWGHSRHELAAAVTSRGLTRVARGVYAAPGVDQTHLKAALYGASITCVSALHHHGVALVHRPNCVHLEVAKGFSIHGRSTRGVHLHFGSNAAPHGFASVATALAVASGCLTEREHLVAFDSALHQGLINLEEVMTWRSQLETQRPTTGAVRFPRARRQWLLAHADGRADSPLESLARLDISAAGMAVHPQFFVDGVGRVDLLVEGTVVVETDGKEHHDNPRAFQNDRERDRKLKRRGYLVLHFTHADVMGPNAVDLAAEVRATLESRAPRRKTR